MFYDPFLNIYDSDIIFIVREVWPEGIFGSNDVEDEEERDMLETIYSTDLGVEEAEG